MIKLLVVFAILGIAFMGLALRVIFIKDGEFHGTCATNNPVLKNELGECIVCGNKPEDNCERKDNPRSRFRFKRLF